MNSAKMYFSLLILLCLIGTVIQLEITASYRTSFQCSNGSYALIGGANLTLEYNYGYNYSQLQSFHLYEVFTGRHMFDYENSAGTAFIKDRDNRLKSYEWTDTGIKFLIPDITRKTDLGKYEGEFETEHDYKQETVEIKEIFDPPAEVILITPDSLKSVYLAEGFGEYVLKALAESYTAITCNSVKIMWMSSTKGTLMSCQAKDYREATVCPLILKESEMTAGECITLEVYAEQYGVSSEKKVFGICYVVALQGSTVRGTKADRNNMSLILGMAIGGVLLVVNIAVIVIVLYWKKKCRGHIQQSKNGEYQSASQADDSDSSKKQYQPQVVETETVKLKEHINELQEEITELKRQHNTMEIKSWIKDIEKNAREHSSLHSSAVSCPFIRKTSFTISETESNEDINSNLGLGSNKVNKIRRIIYTETSYPVGTHV